MKTIESKFAELETLGFNCSISFKDSAFFIVLFSKNYMRNYTHASSVFIHSDNEYPEGFPTLDSCLSWALNKVKE